LLVVAVCVFALAAFAPVAGAATAQVTGGVLGFDAAAGELNTVRLVRPDATTYTLTDTGLLTTTPITAGAGCTQVTPRSVSCAAAGLTSIDVSLGDGDDELRIVSADLPVTAQGGDGNDIFEDDEVVTAGLTPARRFAGDEGDDVMRASITSSLIPHEYVGGGHVVGDQVDYNYRGPNEGGLAVPHFFSRDGAANDGVVGEGDNIGSDVEILIGSEGVDEFTGTAGNDYFITSEGADIVNAGAGDDRIYASRGCDADVLNGGEGVDRFHLGGNTTANGDGGDDQFHSDEQICPGGSDVANGGLGRDAVDFAVEYAAGVAPPQVASLDDQPNDGLGGQDNFHSDIEDMVAHDQGMTLIGGPGANELVGGAGNDRLDGAGGADQLRGGLGVDVADYSARTAPVIANPNDLEDDGEAGEGDGIWTDVENLRGGSGNDTLTGTAVDNVLDGGPGSDTMTGGGGVDAVDYSTRTAPVSVTLASGAGNDGEAGEGDTIASDIEGAIGGAAGDTLAGNAGNGFLSGLGGNDKLSDAGGADNLDAGAGNDEVNSVDGAADVVACGAGTDKVSSDPVDSVAADCEPEGTPVDPPEPPAPPAQPPLPPAPGPGTPTPVAPIDTTAPSASVAIGKGQKLGSVRSNGLKLTVKVGEASTVAAVLTAESTTRGVLKRRGIPAKAVLASVRTNLARAGSKALKLRLTRQGRRALRGLGGARLKLVVTVTDRAKNKRTVTTHLRVKA
jgi:Ca2+-binding RTX toxin-like protein